MALNARELWLYERYFRGRRLGFLPEFYGSCSEGSLVQMVFEHVSGTRPDLKLPRANGLILAALGEINAVSPACGNSIRKLGASLHGSGKDAEARRSHIERHDLGDFPRNLPLHAARYHGLKRGLSHGDLHKGNILDRRPRPGRPDRLDPMGRSSGRLRLRQVHAGRRLPRRGDLHPGASPRLCGCSRCRARRRRLLGPLYADRLSSVLPGRQAELSSPPRDHARAPASRRKARLRSVES